MTVETVAGYAAAKGVAPRTVRRWAARGLVPAYRLTPRSPWRIVVGSTPDSKDDPVGSRAVINSTSTAVETGVDAEAAV